MDWQYLLKIDSAEVGKEPILFFAVVQDRNGRRAAQVYFELPPKREGMDIIILTNVEHQSKRVFELLRALRVLVGHTDFHLMWRISRVFTLGLRNEPYPLPDLEIKKFLATLTLGIGDNGKTAESMFEQYCRGLYELASNTNLSQPDDLCEEEREEPLPTIQTVPQTTDRQDQQPPRTKHKNWWGWGGRQG